jgi:hypothetical protein
MNPELQQRIQNLLGDESMPSLMTTDMPSESRMGEYSSVSVLPKGEGLVEGKDYFKIGGQFFWPWELEGAMGDMSDGQSIGRFIESLPSKPTPKELSSVRDFMAPARALSDITERVAPSFAASGGQGAMSDEEMQLFAGGFAKGGEVSQEEMLMQALAGEAEAQADPNEALRSSIDELMMEASQTDDTAERDKYLQLAEAVEVGSQAPMAEMAIQLAQAGRGEDTALAHVRPGEVILPPEAFEDPEFEEIVERKFRELDLDPERMVVGVGIASLNPITGLEEFGFFKKLAKGVKKVVKKVIKPIAKVAQFIPGPWQPIAAMANKAFTVYDVAKGRASPLSLLTMGKGVPGAAQGKGIGSLFGGVKEFVTKGQDGVGLFGNIGKGIGGLFTGPGADKVGKFGRLGDFLGSIGDATGLTDYAGMAAGQYSTPGIAGPIEGQDAYDAVEQIFAQTAPGDETHRLILDMQAAGSSPEEILQTLQQSQGGSFFGMKTPDFIKQLGDPLGFGGASGLRDAYGGGAGGAGGGGGFLGGGMGGAGGAAIAALLAKLAYDETKNRKGVQLTPAITMSPYGGYQLASMDAERRGEAPPDPREFGMMPRDFMPVLSGGRAPTAAQAELEKQKTGMRYGGAVQPMYFNSGGDVDAEVFIRMNGEIDGEGTEVSDDIPAMLSDGEFVMTGRAVRGAGGFDFDQDKDGIITLIKNGDESREKGTELMYKMMNLFEEFAGAPARARAKS